jgi:hypothetical protein
MAQPVLTNLDFNNVSKIVNLPNASATGEPVTFDQLNTALEGLSWKDSCRVATQSNTNLSSPGATIDGITMAGGDRVLVRAQTAGAENGIYIWSGAAVAMTRSTDCSTAAELEQAVTSIEEGTSANSSYRQTAVNLTLGTTTVTWVSFGNSVPSASESTAGTIEIATQAETDTGTDDARAITPLKLATWSGRIKKYSTTVGDGSATSYTITHNLGTRDVVVNVYENAGSYRSVYVETQMSTTNTITLLFAAAPTSAAYKIVVIA